jgi:hypothetical protein
MPLTTKFARTICGLSVAMALLVPALGHAEEPSEPVPGIDPEESLSEQLDENQGVIEPPSVGDEKIHVPAPDPDPNTTPVIPPPTADDPTVVPK